MMSTGGAVVVKNVTGIEDFAVNEENCLIVKDQEEATEAVRRIFEDPNLRKKLSIGGIKESRKWTLTNQSKYLEKFVNQEQTAVVKKAEYAYKYQKPTLFSLYSKE